MLGEETTEIILVITLRNQGVVIFVRSDQNIGVEQVKCHRRDITLRAHLALAVTARLMTGLHLGSAQPLCA